MHFMFQVKNIAMDLNEFVIIIVDRHSDREPLDEYINKKREMFLVQVNYFYLSSPGLPYLPYFTGYPIFQPLSPTPWKAAAGETKSSIFWL